MTGNPETPGERAPQPGRVAELALVAAGLGLVVYLLGFVDDTALGSSLIGPLLLGGGLLAGSAVLPTVGVRVLGPAAVSTVTGALLLLQTDVGTSTSSVAVAALVLAVLEAAAVTGAALLQAGVLRARPPRPKREKAVAPPPTPPPPYGYAPPQYPGQQYPGQPYPGAYGSFPGDQYAGENAYAQQARYGGQYGVPGYPPPPPYGSYDPYRTTAYPPAAPPEPPSTVPADPAGGVQGSGAFRPSPTRPDPSEVTATGGHAAAVPAPPAGPTATGSHAAVPESGAHRGDEDDQTRAIPLAGDERRPS